MSGEFLISELTHDGQVARLTLDRPPLNVMTIEMMEEINSALLSLRRQEGLKVLVIRGRGEAFCGGVDVRER